MGNSILIKDGYIRQVTKERMLVVIANSLSTFGPCRLCDMTFTILHQTWWGGGGACQFVPCMVHALNCVDSCFEQNKKFKMFVI